MGFSESPKYQVLTKIGDDDIEEIMTYIEVCDKTEAMIAMRCHIKSRFPATNINHFPHTVSYDTYLVIHQLLMMVFLVMLDV